MMLTKHTKPNLDILMRIKFICGVFCVSRQWKLTHLIFWNKVNNENNKNLRKRAINVIVVQKQGVENYSFEGDSESEGDSDEGSGEGSDEESYEESDEESDESNESKSDGDYMSDIETD